MENQILFYVTILSLLVATIDLLSRLFVEWPTIKNRWQEAQSGIERLVMWLSVIMLFGSLPFFGSAFINLGNGATSLKSLTLALLLGGVGYLTAYWIDNKTLAYRRSSSMALLWMPSVGMLLVGILGIVFLYLLK